MGVSIGSWGLSPVANGAAIPGPSVPRGSDSTSTRAELPAGWSVATARDCLFRTRAAATNVDEDESEDCEGCRRLWQRRVFVTDTFTTNNVAHESGSVWQMHHCSLNPKLFKDHCLCSLSELCKLNIRITYSRHDAGDPNDPKI